MSKTILAVDDSASIRQMVAHMLKQVDGFKTMMNLLSFRQQP